MRCHLVFTLIALAGLAGSGCQRSDRTGTRPEPEPAPANEPLPEARPPAAARETSTREPQTRVDDGIPTEEDYEAEAAALITPATLEAELAKLEAEITPK